MKSHLRSLALAIGVAILLTVAIQTIPQINPSAASAAAVQRKTSGFQRSGDAVYYMLASGPNFGKPRPATIVRVYGPEVRRADGTRAFAVDLIVAVLAEDGVAAEQDKVPMTGVGTRDPGTWDYSVPAESGF